MDNKNIFARNLKYYMELNGKTRKTICQDLGFSYYTFSDWVTGKKYPRMDKVEMLANYFNILKSDLIEDKSSDEHNENTAIGQSLVSIREASNLSREEMAKEFNISIEDLKAYEDGIKRIPFELLQRIADYFHVDLNANALFQYRKENNQSNLQTSLNIIKATKRWNEEVGEAQFSDDEVTELINFAKYLISKRATK